jgi:hypothetical protein
MGILENKQRTRNQNIHVPMMRIPRKVLLHPLPQPTYDGHGIALGNVSLVGELQPALTPNRRHLYRVAQVLRPLGAPLREREAVVADLVPDNKEKEDRQLFFVSLYLLIGKGEWTKEL